MPAQTWFITQNMTDLFFVFLRTEEISNMFLYHSGCFPFQNIFQMCIFTFERLNFISQLLQISLHLFNFFSLPHLFVQLLSKFSSALWEREIQRRTTANCYITFFVNGCIWIFWEDVIRNVRGRWQEVYGRNPPTWLYVTGCLANIHHTPDVII